MKIDLKNAAVYSVCESKQCRELIAKLSHLPQEELLSTVEKLSSWEFGRCELGAWAIILNRFDEILESAVCRIDDCKWTIKLDAELKTYPLTMTRNVLIILKFTSLIIKNSIYRHLYSSIDHLLLLFHSSNIEILEAILLLFDILNENSRYLYRLDSKTRSTLEYSLECLADSWGGKENGFGLKECAMDENLMNNSTEVHVEYFDTVTNALVSVHVASVPSYKEQLPARIMEHILTKHCDIPERTKYLLFTRIRLASYMPSLEMRRRCIAARLQSFMILCFLQKSRHGSAHQMIDKIIQPQFLVELTDILNLPDDCVLSLKTTVLKTLSRLISSHQNCFRWHSFVYVMGINNYHGLFPQMMRRTICSVTMKQVSIKHGSLHMNFISTILDFLYKVVTSPLVTSHISEILQGGYLESLQHLLSFTSITGITLVTQAVNILTHFLKACVMSGQLSTILSSVSLRLSLEIQRLKNPDTFVMTSLAISDGKINDISKQMNASELLAHSDMKKETKQSVLIRPLKQKYADDHDELLSSILSFLQYVTEIAEAEEHLIAIMTLGDLPLTLHNIMSRDVCSASIVHQAVETITGFMDQCPSYISHLQETGITDEILRTLSHRGLPFNRHFLIRLPRVLRTLSLNKAGAEAVIQSGVVSTLVNTVAAPAYMSVLKWDLDSGFQPVWQIGEGLEELSRTVPSLRPVIFKSLIKTMHQLIKFGSVVGEEKPVELDDVINADFTTLEHVSMVTPQGQRSPEEMEDEHEPLRSRLSHSETNRESRAADPSITLEEEARYFGHPIPSFTDSDVVDHTQFNTNNFKLQPNIEHQVYNILKLTQSLVQSMNSSRSNCQIFINMGGHTLIMEMCTMPLLKDSFASNPACSLAGSIYVALFNGLSKQDSLEIFSELLTRLEYHLSLVSDVVNLPKTYKSILLTNIKCHSYTSTKEQLEKKTQILINCGQETPPTQVFKQKTPPVQSYSLKTSPIRNRPYESSELFLRFSRFTIVAHIVDEVISDGSNILDMGFLITWVKYKLTKEIGETFLFAYWEYGMCSHIRSDRLSSSIPEASPDKEEVHTSSPDFSTRFMGNKSKRKDGLDILTFFNMNFDNPVQEKLNTPDSTKSHVDIDRCIRLCCGVIQSICVLMRTVLALCRVDKEIEDSSDNSMVHSYNKVSAQVMEEWVSVLTRLLAWTPVSLDSVNPTYNSTEEIVILPETLTSLADPLIVNQQCSTFSDVMNFSVIFAGLHLTDTLVFGLYNWGPYIEVLDALHNSDAIKVFFEVFKRTFEPLDPENLSCSKQSIIMMFTIWTAIAERLLFSQSVVYEMEKSSMGRLPTDFDIDSYLLSVRHCIYQPLVIICQSQNIHDILSESSLIHLLNILLDIIPVIFAKHQPPQLPHAGESGGEAIEVDLSALSFHLQTSLTSDVKYTELSQDQKALVHQLIAQGFEWNQVYRVLQLSEWHLVEAVNLLISLASSASSEMKEELEEAVQARSQLRKSIFKTLLSIARQLPMKRVVNDIVNIVETTGKVSFFVESLLLGSLDSPNHPHCTLWMQFIALLFTRQRFIILKIVQKYNVAERLLNIITGRESTTLTEKTYAILLLNLHERMQEAWELHEERVALYKNCHRWMWFDDHTGVWHPYSFKTSSKFDPYFHNSDITARFNLFKRYYEIDFPTMTQSCIHMKTRRLVMLWPDPTKEAFEHPPSLVVSDNSCLLRNETNWLALIDSLPELLDELASKADHSDCLSALLRLLLRVIHWHNQGPALLVKSNTFQKLMFLSSSNRIPEIAALTGLLLRQVFDNHSTIEKSMEVVMRNFLHDGVKSRFFEFSSCTDSPKDIFYLASVLVPIFARDRDLFTRLSDKLVHLNIKDEWVADGILPKTFIASNRLPPEDSHLRSVKLTPCQMIILNLMMEQLGAFNPASDESSVASHLYSPNRTQCTFNDSDVKMDKETTMIRNDASLCNFTFLTWLTELTHSYPGVGDYIVNYRYPKESQVLTFLEAIFQFHISSSFTTKICYSFLETLVQSSKLSQPALVKELLESLIKSVTSLNYASNPCNKLQPTCESKSTKLSIIQEETSPTNTGQPSTSKFTTSQSFTVQRSPTFLVSSSNNTEKLNVERIESILRLLSRLYLLADCPTLLGHLFAFSIPNTLTKLLTIVESEKPIWAPVILEIGRTLKNVSQIMKIIHTQVERSKGEKVVLPCHVSSFDGIHEVNEISEDSEMGEENDEDLVITEESTQVNENSTQEEANQTTSLSRYCTFVRQVADLSAYNFLNSLEQILPTYSSEEVINDVNNLILVSRVVSGRPNLNTSRLDEAEIHFMVTGEAQNTNSSPQVAILPTNRPTDPILNVTSRPLSPVSNLPDTMTLLNHMERARLGISGITSPPIHSYLTSIPNQHPLHQHVFHGGANGLRMRRIYTRITMGWDVLSQDNVSIPNETHSRKDIFDDSEEGDTSVWAMLNAWEGYGSVQTFPLSFRRWMDLFRISYGAEYMDILLIIRNYMFCGTVERRQKDFSQALLKYSAQQRQADSMLRIQSRESKEGVIVNSSSLLDSIKCNTITEFDSLGLISTVAVPLSQLRSISSIDGQLAMNVENEAQPRTSVAESAHHNSDVVEETFNMNDQHFPIVPHNSFEDNHEEAYNEIRASMSPVSVLNGLNQAINALLHTDFRSSNGLRDLPSTNSQNGLDGMEELTSADLKERVHMIAQQESRPLVDSLGLTSILLLYINTSSQPDKSSVVQLYSDFLVNQSYHPCVCHWLLSSLVSILLDIVQTPSTLPDDINNTFSTHWAASGLLRHRYDVTLGRKVSLFRRTTNHHQRKVKIGLRASPTIMQATLTLMHNIVSACINCPVLFCFKKSASIVTQNSSYLNSFWYHVDHLQSSHPVLKYPDHPDLKSIVVEGHQNLLRDLFTLIKEPFVLDRPNNLEMLLTIIKNILSTFIHFKTNMAAKIPNPSDSIVSMDAEIVDSLVGLLFRSSMTEECITQAIEIISLLCQLDETTRTTCIIHLRAALETLVLDISAQLSTFMTELDSLEQQVIGSSSVSHGEEGCSETITGTNIVLDQIKSMRLFVTPMSLQFRFINVISVISKIDNDTLEQIETKNSPGELWHQLTHTITRLTSTVGPHSGIVLEPLIESFFITQVTVRKLCEDNLGSISRLERTTSTQSFLRRNSSKLFRHSLSLTRVSSSSSDLWDNFITFTKTHQVLINEILRRRPSALDSVSPWSVLLCSTPWLLDFDVKRVYLTSRLNVDEHLQRPSLPILIRSRDRILEESFNKLQSKSGRDWQAPFIIIFQGEEGQDGGGLLREWYLLMSRVIFSPDLGLFSTTTGDSVTYTIDPASYLKSNYLQLYQFVGKFFAKTIHDNKHIECYFTRSFYKHILGLPVNYKDLESEDCDFYRGILFLLENNIDELGLEVTFSAEVNHLGQRFTKELIPNGANIPVTDATKVEYVNLISQERMTGSIEGQIKAFLEGFYQIIPQSLISVFTEQELELLICGMPTIDIEDLRINATYKYYHPNSIQIQWFWRCLRSMSQSDRALFLQFVTGTSRVPLGGFEKLQGIRGPQKFQIHQDTRDTSRLPTARTCFNQLDLPLYESYEKLSSSLLIAIRECSEGFGLA